MNLKLKKILLIIIISLFTISIITTSYLYLNWYKLETLFDNNLSLTNKIIIIFLLYFFRNYLLIPSTVLILFAWYFLENFLIALIISTIWVSIWILQTYFVWYIFNESLKTKKDFKIISKHSKEIKDNWFKVIFTSAFFPIIPLDIIYYSAWFIKYNIIKAYIAWITWEFLLIFLYTYLWDKAVIYKRYLIYIFIILIFLFLIYYIFKKIKKTS